MITRRRTLGMMGSISGLAVAAPRLAYADNGEVVFASWGGTTQEGQTKAWSVPFTEQTGITVLQDGPTDYGKIATMVESGNVQWDVVDVEHDFAIFAGNSGMLEPLDFGVIDRDDLDPRFVTDYGVGSFYYAFVLGFSGAAYGDNPPMAWADLFDKERFPGKRTYYQWSGPGVYEVPLLADGVAPQDLYPLDVDRALAKLDTIKSDIVWWGSGAQSQQLLASGETPIGMFWSGRLHSLQVDGEDIGMSWEQNLTAADLLVVPKGAKNRSAAMQFLAVASSAEGQAEMARQLGYTPTNIKALELLDEATLAAMPTNHADQNVPLNIEYWAENRDMLGSRWYEWQVK